MVVQIQSKTKRTFLIRFVFVLGASQSFGPGNGPKDEQAKQ